MPEEAPAKACVGGGRARVALVIGQLTVGGAEGQLVQVVRGLDSRFESVVVALNGGGGKLRDELVGQGITVVTVGGRGLARARRLATVLRAHRVDLIHSWLFIANAYVLASRLFGVRQPIITSARNCKVQGRTSQIANALAFRASRAIVVNSAEVQSYIMRHYRAPAGRIRVIYNGVDTTRFHPRPEGTFENTGLGTVVTVGRLVPQKDHALFLEAAAELLQTMPGLSFVIAGEGPLRPRLEAQARALGIASHVRFAGERRDVEEILREASLFWLTSRWEGLPNVVLEALASGVPVIATDVGGTRELVRHGMDGFVVGAGDRAAIVDRSLELLRAPERLAEFRRAARARALTFSCERMVEALSQLYDEVLGGKR